MREMIGSIRVICGRNQDYRYSALASAIIWARLLLNPLADDIVIALKA